MEDTFAQQYNDTFDPELHIWEIREIEDAINTSFIRNLIACSNITDQDYEVIKNKITILEKFMMCSGYAVSS